MKGIKLMAKGMAMGVAEVIPGVSGGTIAFITGIYERLIRSIKSFGPSLIPIYKEQGLRGVAAEIDFSFLVFLMAGMAMGFVAGVFVISDLLVTQPEVLWGFFFGLILASCVLIGLEIKSWNLKTVSSLIFGALSAYLITTFSPTEGSLNLLYVYLSAVLAISALMLPGVSGSFVLLLLGMYTLIIPTIKRVLSGGSGHDYMVVFVFGLGALTGLALFSRVLSWLFASYKELSFAAITGFILGSLNKVWPWRNVEEVLRKADGMTVSGEDIMALHPLDKELYKITGESNVWPSAYAQADPKTLYVILFMVIGILTVYLLHKLDKSK